MDFFDTLVENFCHKSGISLKIRKDSQTYFFGEKNPFVSKLFAGHMECGVDNSAKIFSPRNRQLLADCPKFKKFWFVPKLFPRSAPIRWTRRKPSWLVQFFFWSFCRREGWKLDTAAEFFFWEYGSFSLKFRKSIKIAFTWEKVQLTPKFAMVTWNAILATPPVLFCQKPKRFSLSAQKLEWFCFFQTFVP